MPRTRLENLGDWLLGALAAAAVLGALTIVAAGSWTVWDALDRYFSSSSTSTGGVIYFDSDPPHSLAWPSTQKAAQAR